MSKILVLYDSAYGHIEAMAEAVAEGDGSRRPSANESAGAKFQGRHVADITARLTHTH